MVMHGNLSVNVPRGLFSGPEAVPVPSETEKFRRTMRERYPWLSENSLDVLLSNARKVMLSVIDDETSGMSHARVLISKDRLDEAVAHLRRHIEADPNDPDLWYLLGETLCRMGKAREGYEAMNRGRDLF